MDIPDIEIKEENDDFGSIVVKEEYNYYNYAEEPQNNAVYDANGINFIKTEKEDEEPEEIKEELVQFEITEISPEKSLRPLDHVCSVCDERFSTKSSMLLHRVNHFGQDYFYCAHCTKKFLEKKRLEAHLATHRRTGCKICRKVFKNSTALENHMDNEHQIYKCRLCRTTFPRKCRLIQHMKTTHKEERNKLGIYQILYKCTMCSINFEGKKDLLHHHTKHHVGPTKPFKCLYCEMVFTTFGYIEAHVFKNHRGLPIDAIEFPILCSICKMSFNNLEQLKEHSSAHTLDTIYSCGFCKEKFYSEDKIKHHVATFHEKKQLPKGFPEIWKMFSCPTTGRTYYAHCLRKKTEEVPKNRCGPTFTCPICFRKFCKEGTFNNHITKHTREHEDNPADGVTKSEVYMRNGKSKVFFKCRLCNRMYTTRDEVMKHEKCHEEYKNLDRVNSLYLLLKKANSVKTIVRSNNATTVSTKAQTSTIVNSTGVTTIKNEVIDC
ncbi:zinc finger protein 84-like [Lutzomyia longipalpis]|uniref:zinc finger protein 84-like n=1 Tax=Lutzomyia longipalpis TaxID=7200 RepID=UPI002483FCCE|nr:zinc finger protein 84-like [Lutzomyia longipalpis]